MTSPNNTTLNPLKTKIKLLQVDQLGKSAAVTLYFIATYFGGETCSIHRSLTINNLLDNTTVTTRCLPHPRAVTVSSAVALG